MIITQRGNLVEEVEVIRVSVSAIVIIPPLDRVKSSPPSQ